MHPEELERFICQRVSFPRLSSPAPDERVLNAAFKAAFRAPDHMMLRPWRYLLIKGKARQKLGDAFCRIALEKEPDLTDVQQAKYRNMPMRSPVMVVAISRNIPHPKVPAVEQEISCGVGLGYMLLVLQAHGFGGIWRTGALANDPGLKKVLGLAERETVVGFLYVGTPVGDAKPIAKLEVGDYVEPWTAEK